ncbi:hypothetical protein QC764_106100 [Podospora pseudoanserina]|uniref:BHLH domain-containing protein n=1 Tax=Podospora pseudoanserina TaxID=2609844 RepID=A0ABR0ILL3_9PEZI|nr:hypothetical protein QC764_106100 [Podospora pseudoanserina]
MEQTSGWIQNNTNQLPGEHSGQGLPSELQHRSDTGSHGWTYDENSSNHLGYHDPNLHHSITNPTDLSSYQQPVADARIPSPTYLHLETSFDQSSSTLEGQWVSNSPISPSVPYGDIACTFSSTSSIQTSPMILSPANDHWTYQSFPINHTYGVSLSQPDSPIVSAPFDAPHSAREMPASYFAVCMMSDTTLPLDQGSHDRSLSSSTIPPEFEPAPTQHQQHNGRPASLNLRKTTKASGKGQLPSPSTKTKVTPRSKDSKTVSPASSSSIQPHKQTKSNGPSLRTATRRFRRTPEEAPPRPGELAEDQRARENHNQVEKEYRIRLHKGFEELLEALCALPEEERVIARHSKTAGGSVNGDYDDDDEHMAIIGALLDERTGLGLPANRNTGGKGKKKQRRMSKAEVLHYTCRVLKSMGDGNQKLKEEVERLRSEHDMRLKRTGSS